LKRQRCDLTTVGFLLSTNALSLTALSLDGASHAGKSAATGGTGRGGKVVFISLGGEARRVVSFMLCGGAHICFSSSFVCLSLSASGASGSDTRARFAAKLAAYIVFFQSVHRMIRCPYQPDLDDTVALSSGVHSAAALSVEPRPLFGASDERRFRWCPCGFLLPPPVPSSRTAIMSKYTRHIASDLKLFVTDLLCNLLL
jgi:hypothetical protein